MDHSVTNVTIELWQLIAGIAGVLTSICLIVFCAAKGAVTLIMKQLDERFTARDKILDGVVLKVDQVEREVQRLSTQLPNEYVRREDWVRFSGTIDAKLDRLRDKHEEVRILISRVIERLGFGGSKE